VNVHHWWLQSLGPFLASCAVLVALRCGLLPRIRKLWFQLMTVLLRDERPRMRPYRQSFLSAAEAPMEFLCLIRIACHAATFIAMPLLSAHAAKTVAHYSEVVLSLSSKVCLGCILYGVVNVKITRSSRGIAEKSDILGAETSRQESQVLAVGQTARALVVLGTFLSCLPVFKVDLGTVLSFCGMGGLAISLLSKGVIVNIIGSLTIYLTQPFTLGDWIQTVDGEVDGWVQSMGPYHTVVMRWDRRPLYIPNSRFMQVQIINASRMTNRRILMDIPLRLADLDKVDAVLDDIRDLIENHKAVDREQHRLVRLRQIGPYAAMIWVSCYTQRINLHDFVAMREDVVLSIRNIMFKNGTTFATTLEREMLRVDSTGAFLSAPYDSAGSPPLATGEDEVFRKPQPLEATQKALLATELQRLKQMQETLWSRERDLKDSEEIFSREEQRLKASQTKILVQRDSLEEQTAQLEERLEELSDEEEDVRGREEEIEKIMGRLQAQEGKLDTLMHEVRTKSTAEQGELKQRMDEELQQRQQELEEADRDIQRHKEMLLAKKKIIEKQRDFLKEQMAEMDEQDEGSEAGADEKGEEAGEGGDSQGRQGEEAEDEEAELDQAARYQKIAESLGGE